MTDYELNLVAEWSEASTFTFTGANVYWSANANHAMLSSVQVIVNVISIAIVDNNTKEQSLCIWLISIIKWYITL